MQGKDNYYINIIKCYRKNKIYGVLNGLGIRESDFESGSQFSRDPFIYKLIIDNIT